MLKEKEKDAGNVTESEKSEESAQQTEAYETKVEPTVQKPKLTIQVGDEEDDFVEDGLGD